MRGPRGRPARPNKADRKAVRLQKDSCFRADSEDLHGVMDDRQTLAFQGLASITPQPGRHKGGKKVRHNTAATLIVFPRIQKY